MAKHTVYCIRQSRFDGEVTKPGDKVTADDSEMPGLMSSGRFVTEERFKELQAEQAASAKKEKAAKPDKAEPEKAEAKA